MSPEQDGALAHAILKRGWVQKETLQEALDAVTRLRGEDPAITLYQYLGVREILCWERLDMVRETIDLQAASRAEANAHVRAHPPRPPVAHKDVRRAPPPSAGRHAPAPAAAPASGARQWCIIGGGVAVALAVVIVVASANRAGPGSRASGSVRLPAETKLLDAVRAAPGAARQLALAREFLSRHGASPDRAEVDQIVAGIEDRARAEWIALARRADADSAQKRFKEHLAACRGIADLWNGTAAAREAEKALPGIEARWRDAVGASWDAMLALTSAGKEDEALARAREALAWWPDGERPRLVDEIVALSSRVRARDLAMAPPAEQTLPALPGTYGGGSGAARATKPAATGPAEPETPAPETPTPETPEPETPEPETPEPEATAVDSGGGEGGASREPGESTAGEGVKEIEQPELTGAELFRRGRELAKNGEHAQALDFLQRVLNLYPDNVQAQQEWARIAKKIADDKVALAIQAIAADDTRAAHALLVEAYELLPRRETAARLNKLGFFLHRATWLTKKEAEIFDNEDVAEAERCREPLNLGKEYRVVRGDHFRVYTDLPAETQWNKWLDPHLQCMEALFSRYARVFVGLLDEKIGRQALNIVFFKDGPTYQQYRGVNGIDNAFRTAGFYDGGLRASFFYRDGDRPMDKTVLLHEVTHHLNHLALNSASISWVNEGLAQYFEAGRMEKNGTLTVGFILADAFGEIRTRGLKKGYYIPPQTLFYACAPDDRRLAGYNVHSVYAQMWGWTYFFLHCSERHRRALLECLREDQRQNRTGAWSADPASRYVKTLEARKMPLDALEKDYRKFMTGMDWSGKKK